VVAGLLSTVLHFAQQSTHEWVAECLADEGRRAGRSLPPQQERRCCAGRPMVPATGADRSAACGRPVPGRATASGPGQLPRKLRVPPALPEQRIVHVVAEEDLEGSGRSAANLAESIRARATVPRRRRHQTAYLRVSRARAGVQAPLGLRSLARTIGELIRRGLT
jgi:hypothetical protein